VVGKLVWEGLGLGVFVFTCVGVDVVVGAMGVFVAALGVSVSLIWVFVGGGTVLLVGVAQAAIIIIRNATQPMDRTGLDDIIPPSGLGMPKSFISMIL